MKQMFRYLAMAALVMRADLTPEERENLNQFLRGSDKIAE